MNKRSPNSNAFCAILSAALLFSCAAAVFAQSGRRATKSAPAPVATPEPTPAPAKPAENTKPALTFIIGMDRFGDFSGIPLYVASGVLRSFAGRLDEPASVAVAVESQDMGRSAATQRAKGEKEAYVVWLQLVSNNLSGRSGPNDTPNDIAIEFIVLAPTTAKQVTSGRTYPGAYRNRGVIANPRTSGADGDYQLNQAAKAAAERVLDHFHIGKAIPHP